MTETTVGAIITTVALLILLGVITVFLGPGHNVIAEGFEYIYEAINASRVGLGL